MTTLLAALIGAVLGSIGAVGLQHLLTERTQARHRRDFLVGSYLYQLQDAVEALWFRMHNLAARGGRAVMTDDYFEASTLYALGRVLALERIFALEGVYPRVDESNPGLGTFLRDHRIDGNFVGTGFYQYDRLALAETLIEREGERLRLVTYLHFRRNFETYRATEQYWIEPARSAVAGLTAGELTQILESLRQVAARLARATGVPTPTERMRTQTP